MEVYDKFVDRFQGLSKESCFHQGEALISTKSAPVRKCVWEYDAIKFTMIYLKVLYDMVPQNF